MALFEQSLCNHFITFFKKFLLKPQSVPIFTKNYVSFCLMKKTCLLYLFLFFASYSGFAQFFGQIPETTKYKASKVVDPEYGITMYEKLNFQTGGDSVRNDKKRIQRAGLATGYLRKRIGDPQRIL